MQDINRFMNSFEATKKMMKQMQSKKGGMKNALKGLDMNSLKGLK